MGAHPRRSSGANIKLPIYLDYQATTPVDPRVLDAMLPYFCDKFGNPHSISHSYGAEAAEAVEKARAEIAALIGADAREVIFTSGATESNNLALKGVARFYADKYKGKRNHIVTLATEHKCVIETCRRLERDGFPVTFLPVQGGGLVDLDVLRDAIGENTLLVSVMGVNNEIGVIQPLAEIGAIC
ncbi:MAG: aminotransferase class V-fold PLP-dependent enzyme, partial [Alphaproteobacteria bacterium]